MIVIRCLDGIRRAARRVRRGVMHRPHRAATVVWVTCGLGAAGGAALTSEGQAPAPIISEPVTVSEPGCLLILALGAGAVWLLRRAGR